MMRCDSKYKPTMVERPWDKYEREQAKKRAKEIKNKIEYTEWRDV